MERTKIQFALGMTVALATLVTVFLMLDDIVVQLILFAVYVIAVVYSIEMYFQLKHMREGNERNQNKDSNIGRDD